MLEEQRAASLVPRGIGAADLPDGLRKLAGGELAPETLWLRLVELPETTGGAMGTVLSIEGGELRRRAYAPGRPAGEVRSERLSREDLVRIVRLLMAEEASALPPNVWSDRHRELEIRVLGRGHAVVARPFSRLSPDTQGSAPERLRRIFEGLLGHGAETAPAGDRPPGPAFTAP